MNTSPSLNKELIALALKCGAFQNEGGHGIPAGTLITFEADELADFVAALPSALPVEGAGSIAATLELIADCWLAMSQEASTTDYQNGYNAARRHHAERVKEVLASTAQVEAAGYFLRDGVSQQWQQVADEYRNDADVVPLYASPAIAGTPSKEGAAQVEAQTEEAAEIIGSLIDNIESHGMYSKESTLGFLTQAFYCLRPENPAPPASPSEGGGEPHASAQEAAPWSGWACQYPGKLPRLYGAREIADLNLDAENGDQLLFLSAITSESATEVKGVEDAATELSKHSRTDFIRGAQWASKSEHAIIAAFLERTGQYVTNDASREAAIQQAGSDAELQYRQALHCLSDVMRAANHALVSMAPSETEAKLRTVLAKAHDWFMAEVNSDTYMGEPANQPKENDSADDFVNGCPHCGGTGGHWEGCRAPVQAAPTEPLPPPHNIIGGVWYYSAEQMRAALATPAPREHTAAANCWCQPEVDYVDPDTGTTVYIHRESQ